MNDSTAATNTPFPPKRPPQVDLHSLDILVASNSELADLRYELLACFEWSELRTETIPNCSGHVVSTEYLFAALAPHWARSGISPEAVSTSTVVFHLPAKFEPFLAAFVEQAPRVFNYPDVALRTNTTYQGWSVLLTGDPSATEVWVNEVVLDEAINSAYGYPEREGGWVPVVATAGHSVAICGFEVGEALIFSTQAASMHANDGIPEAAYSREELDAAALEAMKFGLTPWFDGTWRVQVDETGECRNVLGATFYDFHDIESGKRFFQHPVA
jgi:hypothetical protein